MGPTVLITCSGLGSRLSPITDYLNKSLIKLGDKAIISYILDSYPADSKFIVTLGYLKGQVKDYLTINHSNLNIIYVEVDEYDGPNSSLLYSLSKTFKYINEPFYYNACDTYIKDIPILFENTAIYSQTFIDNQYRKIINNNIQDYSANIGDFCYTGVAYVKDYDIFKEISNKILLNKDNILSDAHVLQKMNMHFRETKQWIDIGNFIALDHAKHKFSNEICVLEKSDSETYFINGKIVKFFKDQKKVDKLYERHLELKNCTPNCDKLNNFIFYDFIHGETFSKILDEKTLIDFLQWCEINLWTKHTFIEPEFFQEFYINNAKERIKLYNSKHHSANITEINFRKVLDINFILENISDALKQNTQPSRSHGDLIFENVIKTKDGFCLIDWREGFLTNIGDQLYDIAKMKHSLIFDSQEILKQKFYVKVENSQVFYDSATPEYNFKLISIFDQWCADNNIDIRTIDLIVSLIQLSSSGLHLGDDAHLLYYMGWYNLQKIYASS